MNPPFKRTECDCRKCQTACETMPGYLIPGDLERIADFLCMTVEATREAFFLASPGAIVTKQRLPFRIETITPARDKDGHCVFYEGGQCSIHSVSPFGCAFFDTHQRGPTGDFRSTWGLTRIKNSGTYRTQLAILKKRKRIGEEPAVLRRRFLARIKELEKCQ